VVAAGERTVEFRLSAPLADFFGYRGVGSVPIVPKHVWADIDNAAAEQDAAVLVGSGPYRLESYSPGEGAYVYSANDDFFLGTPFVERLEFAPIAEPIAGLQAGDIDAASVAAVRPEVLAPFRDNPDLEVLDQPGGNIGSGLFWNLAKGGALADVRFRQACAHAIDREDMVERMLGGNGMPGNPGWIPSTNPFYVEVEQYAFDREAAETLLDDAGYERTGNEEVRRDPDGEPLSFSLLVAEPVTPMVDLVVRALGEIGVELSPRALDVPTFNQRVIAGESEMSIISFGGMNTDHAAGYLHQVYFSETQTTQHAQGYKNPEVDRLVVAQQHELDESARMELVARAQRLIADDLPILPLVYPDGFTVFDKRNFDAWYYTEGGVASTVPLIENKHAFVTGEMTGLEIRSTD
jgi:peptide/nickel transport system substrate-binding protein